MSIQASLWWRLDMGCGKFSNEEGPMKGELVGFPNNQGESFWLYTLGNFQT